MKIILLSLLGLESNSCKSSGTPGKIMMLMVIGNDLVIHLVMIANNVGDDWQRSIK